MPAVYVPWKTPLLMKWDRVAKFKQRSHLSKNPYLEGMPSIADGACVGATFAWLNRHIQNPAESPEKRAQYLSRDDTWCRIEVYSSAYNNTLILNTINRIKENLPNICGLVDTSSVEAEGYEGLTTLVQHIDAMPAGYYVWIIGFEGPRSMSTHACGFYADSKAMSFFDPNSGEYRIRADRKLDFFKKLYNHYLNYVSGLGVKKQLKFDDLYLVQFGSA